MDRARRILTAIAATAAYVVAWSVLAGAAFLGGIGAADPRGALGVALSAALVAAPFVVGATAGLVAAGVSGATWGRAAAFGALAGLPAFFAWAWSFLGAASLLFLAGAVVAPAWLALVAARGSVPQRGPRWRGPVLAAVVLFAFAAAAAALLLAAEAGEQVVTTVRFRVVDDAPYEPLVLDGVVEARPDVPALSVLEAARSEGEAEATFLHEDDARDFLAVLGQEELARRSAEAGLPSPRYVVRYEGRVMEYSVGRAVVSPP